MPSDIKWASPSTKTIKAIAGTNLKPGDKVVLVYESGAALKSDPRLVAYLDKPDSTSYNATATAFALFSQETEVEERVIQKAFPQTIPDEGFTPGIAQIKNRFSGKDEPHALFLCKPQVCPICGRLMMRRYVTGFPQSGAYAQDEQMKHAGIVGIGKPIPGDDNEESACEVCTAEGRIRFTCAFCEQERGSDLLHTVRHSEAICAICYETLSAKDYDTKMNALNEKHQYDYD